MELLLRRFLLLAWLKEGSVNSSLFRDMKGSFNPQGSGRVGLFLFKGPVEVLLPQGGICNVKNSYLGCEWNGRR